MVILRFSFFPPNFSFVTIETEGDYRITAIIKMVYTNCFTSCRTEISKLHGMIAWCPVLTQNENVSNTRKKWHGVKVGPGPQDPGTRDPLQSLKVGPQDPFKILRWDPGTPFKV